MRARRAVHPGLALVLIVPWLLHCATIAGPRMEGEDLFRAGNLSRAAEAFEHVLLGQPSDKVTEHMLFRLAIIYAAPGETFAPARSQDRIEHLLRELPHTRYRTEALILRRITRQLLALDKRVKTARTAVAELTWRADGCRQTLAERTDEREVLLLMGEEEVASRRACELALAALRRRVLERDEEIGRLNEAVVALERLRRIDTQIDSGSR